MNPAHCSAVFEACDIVLTLGHTACGARLSNWSSDHMSLARGNVALCPASCSALLIGTSSLIERGSIHDPQP